MTGRPLRSVGHYDLLEVIGRGGAAARAGGDRATVHRPARRHDPEVAEIAPEPPKRTLRRALAVLAVLAPGAGAVLAAALVTGANGGRKTVGTTPSAPKTTATRPPTVTIAKPKVLATEIAPIVDRVSAELDAQTARMDSASVAKQRSITPASQGVYITAIRELAMQPAAIRDAPLTRSVDATFQRLDHDFGSILAAARANSRHRYALARAQIEFDMVRLGGALADILNATDGRDS